MIINRDNLKIMLIEAKLRGEKIVMTNGVFDILHLGHIYFLNSAKKLGDKLIVAVNDDNSTKILKGNSRPINLLLQRMSVLSALKMVDWVIPFYENTPKFLIADLLPDVLVKGADYQLCNIDGSEEVLANGGQVCTVSIKKGFSTTNIIDYINKNMYCS